MWPISRFRNGPQPPRPELLPSEGKHGQDRREKVNNDSGQSVVGTSQRTLLWADTERGVTMAAKRKPEVIPKTPRRRHRLSNRHAPNAVPLFLHTFPPDLLKVEGVNAGKTPAHEEFVPVIQDSLKFGVC